MLHVLWFGCALFLYFLPQSFLRRFANSIISCWNKLAEVAQLYVKRGSLIQASASWVRMSAWTDQSGTPQPSLELDASQLVLLDRAENGSAKEQTEEIPF